MTIEMLIGGLIVLTMVAGIVLATTSRRDNSGDNFDEGYAPRKDRDSLRQGR